MDSLTPVSKPTPPPHEYHRKFWEVLSAYPDIVKAFKANHCDWNKLPKEQKNICTSADQQAKDAALQEHIHHFECPAIGCDYLIPTETGECRMCGNFFTTDQMWTMFLSDMKGK
jgi:hypothetical protein